MTEEDSRFSNLELAPARVHEHEDVTLWLPHACRDTAEE